ncbi:MATE family efflux transporter [Motiliproteus sp. MSK22-1]|nr:MATE family efflux transporter [Motiliproteus sp. MSK22-1]
MILSNLTVPLLGLVDTAVIGHLPNPLYLGAVAIGASLFSVLFWGFGFLRMGTTGLTAQAVGAENHQEVNLLLAQSLIIALLIGLLLILFQRPLIELGLMLMEPSQEVMEQAWLYCNVRIFSAPAVLANYALLGWFLGLQNSRVPLLLLITANLINISLDLLLVVVLNMAVEGVALATVCADYSALLLGLWLAVRHLRHNSHKLPLAPLLRWKNYSRLIRSNRYLLVRTLLLLLTFCFFTAQGARMGNEILAANAVLLNFLLLISHGLDGFAHATEALCGKYYGAKEKLKFYSACQAAFLWSFFTALLFFIFFALGGQLIIELLTDIPEVITTASEYLPWLTIMPLLGVWSYLLDGIFIGANRFRWMQNCMLLSVAAVFVPSWYFSQPWGNHGLWFSLSFFLLARGLTAGLLFYYCDYRKARQPEGSGGT